MSKTWYYQLLSEEFGPVTESEIRDLLDCETLSHEDLVRAVDSPNWVAISSTEAFAGETLEFADMAELERCFSEPALASSKASIPPSRKVSAQLGNGAVSINKNTVDSPETYYYQASGRTFGPVVVVELIGMAEAGVISASDLVRRGDAGEWTSASGLKELAGVLVVSRQSLVEQVKAADLEKKSRQSASADSGTKSGDSSPQIEKAKVPKRKPKPVEDKFLLEIFEEISANKARTNSAPPTPAIPTAAQTKPDEHSSAASQNSPRVQTAASPMQVRVPTTPSYSPMPVAMATPAISTPRPVPMPSRSSSGSSFSFDGPLKHIVIALVVLAAVGGVWQTASPLFGGSIVGSYSSRVTAVMEQYKAIGPSPSPDEWSKFANGVRMEFVQYYKDSLSKGATDPASLACIDSMKQVMALASTKFDETAKRKEIEATIEKKIAETSK